MGPSLFSILKETNFDNKSNISETINIILKSIENGEEKFISVIENLGYLLTSQKDHERKQGTHLLVDILIGLRKDFLSEKEIEHLVTFFTDRLKDYSHIVPFVIQGLLCLTTYENLSEGAASVIILCLFHNLHIPSQLQNERYACYSIVGNLLSRPKQLRELQSLSLSQQSEIVLGFLQACDGERDPRCLLLSFRVGKIIGTNFPLGAMTEDFFESFNCYFPVDFKPPDDNNRAITREDLAVSLRDCLACSPAFAEFLFPFWLDKIDSTLDLCKLDCLDLLKEVCKIYVNVNVEPFLSQIWSKLRKEVLTNDSKLVEVAALESLSCLVRVIDGNTLIQFISKVWRECEALLDSSSDGLKIIVTIAKASELAGYEIMNMGLPSLLEKISPNSNATEARKVGALSAICSFLNLDQNEKFTQIWQNYGNEVQISLFSLWHISGETKLLAMRGLSLLLSQYPNGWSIKETELLVQHLIYWTRELESDTQNTISGCWNDLASSLAKYDQNIIVDKLLPLWLENLKASINVSKSISLLSAVACVPRVTESIISHILNELNSNTININHLKCLRKIANSGSIKKENLEGLFNQTITLIINNCTSSIFNSNYIIDEIFRMKMTEICLIVEHVTPLLYEKSEFTLAMKMISLTTSDINGLSIERQLLLCKLQLSLISNLPKESLNSIPSNQLSSFMRYFCQFIINSKNEDLTLVLAQTTSCVLNKRDSIDEILQIVEETLPTSNISSNLVIAWIWICKALVLRGHNYNATDKLLEFLGDEINGKIAAEGFCVILEKEKVLSESPSANIKLFYQQRFFMTTHKKLLENYHNSNNDYLKNNCLRALTHQLKYLPAPVLKKELPPLLPMLISSLAKSNNDLLLSVLGSLKELLSTDVSLAVDYLNTLINRMTILSTQHPNMVGRILALECLYFMALLPEVHTIKHAKELVLNLKPCLDDPKRLVRKQATLTISQWYLHINCKE